MGHNDIIGHIIQVLIMKHSENNCGKWIKYITGESPKSQKVESCLYDRNHIAHKILK